MRAKHVNLDSLFIVAPIVCGGSVFGLGLVIQYFVSFLFCNHPDGEERIGCLITYRMYCYC